MKFFDSQFRLKLQEKLIQNKTLLKESCLKILNSSINNYYRVIIDNISSQYSPFKLDLISSKECIDKTIDKAENPTLRMRKIEYKSFWDNEIYFKIIKPDEPVWGSTEQIKYRIERINLEYLCEAEFWKDSDNLLAYERIGNFDCFENVIKPISELQKYQNQDFIYNVDGWINFILKLVEKEFPEYVLKLDYSSSNVLRFLKPLSDGILFGFEYDKRELINSIKKGDVCLPNYFNIILISQSFNRRTKRLDYIFNYCEDILSLGILNNPFFFEPCFPLLSFQSVEMFHDSLDMENNTRLMHKRSFITLPDETFQIKHPEEYGEKLKKHAFFYMQCLKYSSVDYLEYVKKSIIDSIIVG